MKAIELADLLERMPGTIVQGEAKRTLVDVTRRRSTICNQALYFDMEEEPPGERMFRKYRGVVMVTDRDMDVTALEGDVTVVKVDDVWQAFWAFVKYYRDLFELPVIGVTGTCGKTTTKEMIVHILSEEWNVVSTFKSRNGLGWNLSYLTEIEDDTQAAVIEMGVTHPENLLNSSRYFQPSIGVITTIGVDHLQHCKTLDGYIQAKGRMLEGLRNQGTLVINGDDENIKKIDLSGFCGEVVRFGLGEGMNLRAQHVHVQGDGMAAMLNLYGVQHELFVPGFGVHNVRNALAALAVVRALGWDLAHAVALLRTFRPVERHLEISTGLHGCKLIDDTWSSNPTSAEAALKLLEQTAGQREKIAVLGRMGQLGKESLAYHRRLGEQAVQHGVDVLITIGEEAKPIADGAMAKGMPPEHVHVCETVEDAVEVLRNVVQRQSVVLLKTSMESKMSGLVEAAKDQRV